MNYKTNPTHVMMIFLTDDDFPNFILLLGEMLMVKIGVSDCQQAPPHRTFARPELRIQTRK